MTELGVSRYRLPAILVAALVLILCAAVAEFMLYQDRLRRAEVSRQQVTSVAGEVRAIIEAELNASLHLTSGLISYIQARRGQLQAEELEPWLNGLLRQGRHIRNIGLAPGNRITYMYPLAGNEKAIGLYYPDNALQWPSVERAILERRPLLDGPVSLMQGGIGLIHRIPVFFSDGSYWGIVSTVINADELFQLVDKMARERGLIVALARRDGPGTGQTLLMGEAGDVDKALAKLQVTVPGGQWQLTAVPVQGAMPAHSQIGERTVGWLLSLTLAGLVYLLLKSSERKTGMLQALAESQQRFTKAFETAPQGMALLDMQGRWLDANDVLCQLLGYSRDELRVRTLSDVTHVEDRPIDAQAIAVLLSNRLRSEQWEKRFVSRTGESIDCLCSMACVESQPSYLIAQVLDVRETKRLDRMKSEFVSTVSHELRTPLTSIAGSLGLITGGALGELSPQIRPMLDIAHKNSLRLSQLINDLLDMDKLVAGKMEFDLRIQPLQPLLEEALVSNRAYAEKYGVDFVLAGASAQQVNVDGMRLQQVMANFLSNAAKFSPAGGVVTVTVTDGASRVRVSVHDNGPGIPDGFKARIFQKFSQADASDTRQKGGTGLGLAITKEMVERMGGTVGFDSQPGTGSTFWFELACVDPLRVAA